REVCARRRELLDRYESLTSDEKQVLELTAAGKPDKAIALALDLSLRTIQLRRASVMRKMQVHSRAELIGLAHRLDRVPTVN
ncbi:MAG: DNA-binding response regulator, partial [Planctomycetes bacterium]|nr:DNA-binding response regulator [Planctomycetota bacterium]